MIEIKVKRDDKGNPVNIEIQGHALFAPHGNDIVCAAVSVLTQTIIFALEDLVGLKLPVKMEEGYLLITPPAKMGKEQEEKCHLLLETMLLGLEETAKAYPRYILFKDE
jgi:uncharacterized protein YsxB (DUF464 family)